MRRPTVAGLEALEERRRPQTPGRRTAGSSARSVPLRRDNRATPSRPRGSRAPGPASPRAGCRGPLGRIGLCRNAMEPRNQAGALPPARMSWRCRRTWERAGSTPDGASSRTTHAHSLQRTCGPTSLRSLTLLHHHCAAYSALGDWRSERRPLGPRPSYPAHGGPQWRRQAPAGGPHHDLEPSPHACELLVFAAKLLL